LKYVVYMAYIGILSKYYTDENMWGGPKKNPDWLRGALPNRS